MTASQPPTESPERIDAPEAAPCRALLLARVLDAAVLRRRLGRVGTASLVKEVSERLARCLPGTRPELAGRDLIEVAVDGQARVAMETALAAVADAFREPLLVAGESVTVDLALGAATVGKHEDEVELIETAERALADSVARRRPVVLDLANGSGPVDRIALERDLHLAIERGELFLNYQPKVSVRRQEVAGVEALIRWRHPTRGLVQPNDFIPLAEETRAIAPLTLWTIRQALADQALLVKSGHDLPVSVNIAGALLGDARFVRDALDLVGGAAGAIGFEVTETSVIRDPESAIANLKLFADIGVPIAIDDYGAGLSSLAYLKRLPARELKIDKLFVTQLTSSNRDPLIVRSTIDLAHALEMEVVAEGVETEAALALLSVMGCDMVQGFLISRPVEFPALIAYLEEGKAASAVRDTRANFRQLASKWKRA